MTPTTRLPGEYFELTKTSEPSARIGSASPVYATAPAQVLKFVVPEPPGAHIPPDYETLDSVVAEFERSPDFRKEMKQARVWVADKFLADEPLTLRKLRLRRGLSQAQLAESIGTQQPHVARIEKGQVDLRLETCRRLAGALGVDLNTLDQALQRLVAA